MQTRTWNNLIIFVMLGMLVLFFVLNQKINTPQDVPAQLLIPHEMQLTRWQSAGIDLQRNTQGRFFQSQIAFQTQQPLQLSDTAINRLLAAWESAVISSEPLTPEQIAEISFTEALPALPVVLTTVEYADSQLRREIAINVIRLPQYTFLQLNERYYVLLKPEGVYLIP
ncbi:MAG: hypothetical protein P8J70_05125 [Glaciecola sp.]|nr:hypothetical protein [Glaciecola sp.]MDG1816844.1 hypothetical protein [Glaciecola sp.]MDG2099050.1 hypothetical protein [Glaciecola sp.]